MWIPWSLHPDLLSNQSNQVSEVADDPVGQEASEAGVDIRPHIYDPVLETFLLCDSGSQVSAFPPDPGDVPVKTTS